MKPYLFQTLGMGFSVVLKTRLNGAVFLPQMATLPKLLKIVPLVSSSARLRYSQKFSGACQLCMHVEAQHTATTPSLENQATFSTRATGYTTEDLYRKARKTDGANFGDSDRAWLPAGVRADLLEACSQPASSLACPRSPQDQGGAGWGAGRPDLRKWACRP